MFVKQITFPDSSKSDLCICRKCYHMAFPNQNMDSFHAPVLQHITGNDDAIRAVKLISGAMADAVLEGKQGKQDAPAAEEAAKAE